MHLGNAFVRYLCVSNSNNANFFKNRKSWHFDVIFDCLASRSSWIKKSLTRVDFESSQEIDIKYLGRARMLISKPDLAISLLTTCLISSK